MKAKKLLIALAVIVILGLLYWINPTESAFAPKCIFHSLTGLSCPGCGMQRFLHAFLHGRFAEAISYNYMLAILVPYIILYGFGKLVLTGNTQERWLNVLEGRAVTLTMVILAPAWFIVRNIFHI